MRGADIDDTIFMYDITSVYFEGKGCPLARFGYNRDGKKGKLQIVVGMLTNSAGRPLGVRVFNGNTRDDSTVLDQMRGIKADFGVEKFIFVGDRGMVTGAIRSEEDLLPNSGIDYITALTRNEIIKLANDDSQPLQFSLFDDKMAEVEDNGIRYVLCHNPLKSDEDKTTRLRLLAKTEFKLESVARNVESGKYKSVKVIARRLYKWLDKWGMGKCFKIDYAEGLFKYERDQERLDELARLDGCYVITTTVKASLFNKEQVVEHYKRLTWVEQAFRHMKTTDEFIRPVRHWNEDRVRGHVFVCMLAYLAIWQARRRFSEFLERDEDTCECEGDSLREIWEALDKGVVIGTIDIDGTSEDQLAPIPNYQKRLLKAAKASINKEDKKRLAVVG
jgi:transposase